MTDKVLNLIFKATDKTGDVMKDIEGEAGRGGIGGITAALGGLVIPAGLAYVGIQKVGGAVSEMMRDWQSHVIGIADFADVLGISNVEASNLNAIAGEFNITQGDMLTVMENLVKNGLKPTVQGLQDAKDLIFKSEDPTIRLTTAMDLLGKKGAEDLLPMFKNIDQPLKDYIENMGYSVEVTDEMERSARESQKAMDELDRVFGSLKMTVAGWAAPGITDFLNALAQPFSSDSAAWFIKTYKDLWGGQLLTGLVTGGSTTTNIYQTTTMPTTTYTPSAPVTSTPSGSWPGAGHQHGGEFTVGGFGGPDSQMVSFAASPGEKVRVGGTEGELVAEIRRLVNSLPIMLRDAVERT